MGSSGTGDGSARVTGAARYTSDVLRPGMLYARLVHCPHAHARITRLDTAAAAAMPGVKAVRVLQGVGSEIQWALDEIVLVAAATEEQAEDAVRAVVVEYEVLPHSVDDRHLDKAPSTRPGQEEAAGEPDKAMAAAAIRVKGTYGLPVIADNRLEAHGQICEPSAAKGGGSGGEPGIGRWGAECVEASRQAGGVPVKLILERDAELALGGDRPSAWAEIEVGAAADGTLTAWISKSWGSGGTGDPASLPLPDVVQIPNRKQMHTSIVTNTAGSFRAGHAPGHPQGCYLTMSALDDLCARLGMDPLAFYRKNEALLGPLARTYMDELEVADRLMGWSGRWTPRGPKGNGPVQRGLGLALQAWGGAGGVQMAEVEVDMDTGVVEVRKMVAVQDCGLVVDRKAAESQVHGALVRSISSALCEEKVLDPVTGTLLNTDFESYKMAGIADVGELVVHLMTGPGYAERGAIDLGEPLSTGAAIGNAVANALGVRVPFLPLTPQQVLDALQAHGKGMA